MKEATGRRCLMLMQQRSVSSPTGSGGSSTVTLMTEAAASRWQRPPVMSGMKN